jgi:hypothetical protein
MPSEVLLLAGRSAQVFRHRSADVHAEKAGAAAVLVLALRGDAAAHAGSCTAEAERHAQEEAIVLLGASRRAGRGARDGLCDRPGLALAAAGAGLTWAAGRIARRDALSVQTEKADATVRHTSLRICVGCWRRRDVGRTDRS